MTVLEIKQGSDSSDDEMNWGLISSAIKAEALLEERSTDAILEAPADDRAYRASQKVFQEFKCLINEYKVNDFFFDENNMERRSFKITFNASCLKDFNPVKRYLFDPEFHLTSTLDLKAYFEGGGRLVPSFEKWKAEAQKRSHCIHTELDPSLLLDIANLQRVKQKQEMRVAPNVIKVAAGAAASSLLGYAHSSESMGSLLGVICSISGLIACGVAVSCGTRNLNHRRLERSIKLLEGLVACKKLYKDHHSFFTSLEKFETLISQSQNEELKERALHARTSFQRFRWAVLSAASDAE